MAWSCPQSAFSYRIGRMARHKLEEPRIDDEAICVVLVPSL